MRVEQRIGRVHRLGQTHDVNIYNLSTRNTIEEHILSLLHEKINMFELVIGQLDTILEKIEKKGSLETSLFRMVMEAGSSEDIRRKIDELGHSFTEVKSEIEQNPQYGAAFQSILDAVGSTHNIEVRP